MKAILLAAAAITSIGTVHAQFSSFSFSGSGTGSGSYYDLDYTTWTYWENITIENGPAFSSFTITFEDGAAKTGSGGGYVTSPDGLASLGNSVYGENSEWGPCQGVSFAGTRTGGSGWITQLDPASNGTFNSYFYYSLQSPGLYTVTGGTWFWYQAGRGERALSAFWELRNVHVIFVDAPIPEPAAWAMLLGGLGTAGAVIRRGRARVARG